jgi:hypothetical protein
MTTRNFDSAFTKTVSVLMVVLLPATCVLLAIQAL